TAKGTLRNTYVNIEGWKMVHDAFYPLMQAKWESLLVRPIRSYYANQIILDCRDTTLFTFFFVPRNERNDQLWIKNKLSYEQVLPLGTDETVAAELMRRDLVNYFLTQRIALD